MRLARPAALAAASFLLAAAAAGTGAVARGAGPASQAAGAGVTIWPDTIHAVNRALATPPTTSLCEQRYHIACYRPAQI